MHTAIKHLQAVREELGPVAQWYNLGLNLGFYADRLDVIERQERLLEDQLRLVLCDWLTQIHDVELNGLPSWKKLADAVQPINAALAKNIRTRHL